MHIHAQNHQITQEVEKDLQTQQYWSDSVLYILTSNTFPVFFLFSPKIQFKFLCAKSRKKVGCDMNVFQNRDFGFCEKSNKYQLIIAIYLLQM